MSRGRFEEIRVIDTHTGGEPTRVVLSGGPQLGPGSIARRSLRFRDSFDPIRSAIVNEPRGSDVLVGALVDEPVDAGCAAAVIFFNNVGILGMCGHGTIGVGVALAHAGRITAGEHRLETPVGPVALRLHDDHHQVSVDNVASFRHAAAVTVTVPGHGPVTGDVGWGGNWFFLVEGHGQALVPERVAELTTFTLAIRRALEAQGVTGRDGARIDHVELFTPADPAVADSRSFVLCPGGEWDRSPCGTGTSAKLACLAADGRLRPGQRWRQESIIGSVFEARYRRGDGDTILPTLTGSAWVTAESTLLLDRDDPFRTGFRHGRR